MCYPDLIMRNLLHCITILILVPALAAAQNSGDPTLGDHPLMSRFPASELEDIEVLENVNYRLVLGSLQGTRQGVEPERSLRLSGDVTKIVYQVSQQFSSEEVYEFFQEQIRNKDYTVLFSCTGRNCGSSNDWANSIFNNRILYGPQRNQYFMALRVGEESNPRAHMAVYIITRANRRIYAYLEIVEDDVSQRAVAIASPALLESLNEQGSVAIPSVGFVSDSELADSTDLQSVVELIQSEPALNFYVVAHLGGSEPLDVLIQRSTARAELIRQALVRQGVAAERLQARGVGPLAPACDIANCAERVELVLSGR